MLNGFIFKATYKKRQKKTHNNLYNIQDHIFVMMKMLLKKSTPFILIHCDAVETRPKNTFNGNLIINVRFMVFFFYFHSSLSFPETHSLILHIIFLNTSK